MKTLRFIGVALLTVLLSVSFSACGGDDGDNGGGDNPPTSVKFLKKCVEVESDGNTDTYVFNYDNQGRVTRVSKSGSYSHTLTLTYSENQIIQQGTHEQMIYTLENGLVVHVKDNDGEHSYTYENGYLATVKGYNTLEKYYWSNGNVQKIEYYDIASNTLKKTETCEYTNYTYSQDFLRLMSDWPGLAKHCGKTMKNLPYKVTVTKNGQSVSETYNWTMKDGYPIRCSVGQESVSYEWE